VKIAILIFVGLVGGFLSSYIQGLFISRRDKWRYSKFAIFLWKLSWWVGGFIFFSGLTYYFFMK